MSITSPWERRVSITVSRRGTCPSPSVGERRVHHRQCGAESPSSAMRSGKSIIGGERRGSIIGGERRGSIIGGERRGSITGGERRGSITGIDRRGSITGSEVEGPSPSSRARVHHRPRERESITGNSLRCPISHGMLSFQASEARKR